MESTVSVNTTSSGTLKRTRSRTNINHATTGTNSENPTTSAIPALPKINGEVLIQVLTHRSLRRANDDVPDEFDNERLSQLGEKVLDTAVTVLLFNRRPVLTSTEILEQRKTILSDENFDGWVSMYRLRDRVRCLPELIPSLNTPEESRNLFHAYIGGLYAEGGLDPVQKWIDRLVNNDGDSSVDADDSGQSITIPSEPSGPPPYPHLGPVHSPPQKRIKAESATPTSSPSTTFFAAQPHPSPTPSMVPRPQAVYSSYSQFATPQQSFSNPLAPAQPNLAFLPLFNQTASQRRVTVEYPAQFTGPSHAGRWTVQCVVNGISKGVGTGGTKQVAKEEAARQAYYAMGWS